MGNKIYEGSNEVDVLYLRVPRLLIIKLMSVRESFAYKLSKKLNLTYSGVTLSCSWLERNGIITSVVDGRTKYLYLTSKGKRIAEHLNMIKEEFEK